jgi:hypothetical protein
MLAIALWLSSFVTSDDKHVVKVKPLDPTLKYQMTTPHFSCSGKLLASHDLRPEESEIASWLNR